QLIQVVECLALAVNRAMPFREVEAQRKLFVDAGEVPVAKKLGDVRQLVVEARHINADLSQFPQNIAARTQRTFAEIAIRTVERNVENAVVRFQFGKLQ